MVLRGEGEGVGGDDDDDEGAEQVMLALTVGEPLSGDAGLPSSLPSAETEAEATVPVGGSGGVAVAVEAMVCPKKSGVLLV